MCSGLGGKDLPRRYPASCEHGSSSGALAPTSLYPDDTSHAPFPRLTFVGRNLFRVSLVFPRVLVRRDNIRLLVFALWLSTRER